jgi:uncharacterized protein (DUF885 family)
MFLSKIRSIFIFVFIIVMMFDFSPTHSIVNEDVRFDKFREYFIAQYWKIHPVEAIYAGYHLNDGEMAVYDKEFLDLQNSVLDHLSDSLDSYDEGKLSVNNKTDYRMIRDKIAAERWYLNEFKQHEWNPAVYNIGGEFAEIIGSNVDSLDIRLRNILSRLKDANRYYQAAISNIKNPTLEHTALAILQNEGAIEIFTKQIPDSAAISGLSGEEKETMREYLDVAVISIRNYLDYLRELQGGLEDGAARSFRIGEDLYNKKFEHDINSGYKAGEIFEKALNQKQKLHAQMAEISKRLWTKYMNNEPMPDDDLTVIRKVIDKISLKHVEPESFMAAIEKQIPELMKFVNEKNLLYLDPAKPLVVRKTPAYMEGSGAGASISAPGPYDVHGKTFYNVSPLTGYTPEQAESYLREYNYYILQILNIHEAIPGHYAQLVYSNKAPSLIKSLFGNGAMVEGWAVYAERMMLEEGYGNNEPEMWLMYYKWNLRSVCNTILDYSVHVTGWDEAEVIRFLTRDAFQQKAEAEGKWRRVKLTQVQLCSYFTGYTEIYELREEMKKKLAKNLT